MIWITKVLSGVKANLFFVLGLVVSGLLIAVKVLTGQNSRLRQKAETAEARIHHAKVVAKKRQESKAELLSRTQRLAKDLDEKKTSSELEEPNDW